MMKTSPAGIALIKEFEGLELTAYRCSANTLTIGYGHTGTVKEGEVITPAQAEALLAADLAGFERAVAQACPKTTQAQFDAMVCLAFNIGARAFAKSSVARLHNAGDVAGAARAFGLWNKATGADGKKHELRGLTRRRAAEAALYLSDDGLEDDQRTRAVDVEPPKPLTHSKTMIGSATAATATAASGVSQVAEEIDGIKEMLLPLMPYLPAIQTAFIVLGLIGVAVAMYARWKDRRAGRV